ncbi:MAG: dephospho-CoA kinase [Brevirhabdus sp.]
MSRAFLIGLTGSIGMGKTTTARFFEAEGVPVWDADAAVHRLYSKGGAAVAPLTALRPEAIVEGAVDRGRLKHWIADDPEALGRIEAVVHPLVTRDRAEFVAKAEAAGADIIALDIPLLFETGAQAQFDMVVVVSAPKDVQRERVMERPGMTDGHFQRILSKQVPDEIKRKRADRVIETVTLEAARKDVRSLISEIREGRAHA